MISGISGTIAGGKDGTLIVATGGISYEILVPLAVMKAIGRENGPGGQVELVTYHYYQVEHSRSVPVLIGFQNEVEKEFFEKFISVSGVGPKAACKALTEPFSVTAKAIDTGNISFLKSLPGIGEQRARLIVAKLQGKVGKFGLIQDTFSGASKVEEDIRGEALMVLSQLQYRKSEAQDMISKALDRNPDIRTSEELLNEVYRERKQVT
ncbi:MAG: Holliday junction DNA helicase RuvA [Candidatus Omnitrophica bacterium]|nr:Holliday junction DNA helicase RuvA [Candidatus Omnitrophota bacterium]